MASEVSILLLQSTQLPELEKMLQRVHHRLRSSSSSAQKASRRSRQLKRRALGCEALELRRVLAASISSFIGPLELGQTAPEVISISSADSSEQIIISEHVCEVIPAAPLNSVSEEAGVPLINEFVNNHTGSDAQAFVEIFVPGVTGVTDLSSYTLLNIEGESATDAGVIDIVSALGSTDAAGYLTVAVDSENSSMTWMLVDGFTGAETDDIDTNDDGVIDNMPWTSIVDSVSVADNNPGFSYSPAELAPFTDGNFFSYGGAARVPNGMDTDSAFDWVRNAFNGAGFAAFPNATAAPGEAINTPGAANATQPAVASIIVGQTGGGTEVSEEGPTSDAFNFILATEPTADVVITVSLSNAETMIDLGTLTFTNSAGGTPWDARQFVNITAIDDLVTEGVHTTTVSFAVSSSDGNYDGFVLDDLIVSIEDNEGGSSGVNPGDLVINEIMQNPSAVGDGSGEYFELWNTTGADIDINGYMISDLGSDSHIINAGGPLLVPANGYAVLGNNSDVSTNGGVTIAYQYSGIALANGDDELVVTDNFGVEIDRVAYDGGPDFPDPNGASMELKPGLADPGTANDSAANWQVGSEAFGDGDLGTPGAVNSTIIIPAGITIVELDDSTDVAESGPTSDTFTVVLDAEPTADVTITLATADGETTVDLTTLVFTATGGTSPWDTPQTVTVTAVDDADLEANHNGLVTFSVASGDADYNVLTVEDLSVNITDNDGSSGLSPGDLVINELMQNPNAVGDNVGEYLELWNTTGADIDIEGFVLSDEDGQSHTIANDGPVIVPANGYAVLAASSDELSNGGITVDYEFDFTEFGLSNGADEVIVSDNFGLIIDQVNYDGGPVFPDPNGASMELIPGLTDPHLANDSGENWQVGTASFGFGDLGTPGEVNSEPVIPPGVLIVESGDSTDVAEEATTSDTFTIALESEPLAPVFVTIITSDGETTTDLTSLEFFPTGGPTPWDTPQTVTVTAVDDGDLEGDHTGAVTFTVSSMDLNYEGLAVGSVLVNIADNEVAPPVVESVVVNDGAASRSQITSVTVTFDSVVDHGPLAGAFSITNVTSAEVLSTLQVSPSDVGGKTVVELTFNSGLSVDDRAGVDALANSLSDGNYRLDILASAVQTSGVAMASDYEFGGDASDPIAAADSFFRLFGDTDGDRDVDAPDLSQFSLTFLKAVGDAGFDPDYDFDGDGDVDSRDYAELGKRFSKSI